jgi:hypothetical protein
MCDVSEESAASSVSERRLALAAEPIWAGKSDIGPVYCSPRQLSVRSWSKEVARVLAASLYGLV